MRHDDYRRVTMQQPKTIPTIPSPPDIAVVIVAAGTGSRVGGALPKQYREVAGQPVIRWTLTGLAGRPGIRAPIVSINPAHRELFDACVLGLGPIESVPGGATRQDSTLAALERIAASPDPEPDLVLVHDAARPFTPWPVFERVIDGALSAGGAIAALPVTDTVKRCDSTNGIVETIDRDGLWRAQTPQGFRFAPFLEAHRSTRGLGLTDDAQIAESAGLTVKVVPGHEDAMKITTEADIERAEAIGRLRLGDLRVGSGFDVHRFAPGEHVTICGVRVVHDRSLEGHSDADVGLHALTDAILGAIGAGDIGSHFPPTDPRWKGVDSALFLRHAAELVVRRGGVIANVDITVLCEAPKIAPHRDAMRGRVAEILKLDPDRVSIKATTTERLGFLGRKEGIAACATATVRLPG